MTNLNPKCIQMILSAFFILFPAPYALAAPQASGTLDRLVSDMIVVYMQKRPKAHAWPLAVTEFDVPASLEKRQVGLAVAELLSHRFVVSSAFTVVERTALNQVLEEQKLQLTGMVDKKTAVRVGKLIGAKVLVLGTVQKIGGYFQVNSRMVDGETGEVLASGYCQIDAIEFNKETKPFLPEIQRKRRVALFLAAGYGFMPVTHIPSGTFSWTPPTSVNPSNNTSKITPIGTSSDYLYGGVGIKFHPRKDWMLSLTLFPNIHLGFAYADVKPYPGPWIREIRSETNARAGRLGINRIKYLSRYLDVHAGLETSIIQLDESAKYLRSVQVSPPGPDSSIILKKEDPVFFVPTLRLGLEFTRRRRFGWGIFGNLNLLRPAYDQKAEITYSYLGKTVSTETVIRRLVFPRYFFDTTLSFYF